MRHGHIIIFVFFVLLFTAGVIYMARRTAFCFSVSHIVTTTVFVLLFLSVIAALSSNSYVKGDAPVSHVSTLYCCYMAGFMLYLLIVTSIVHVCSLPFNITPIAQGITTYAITILAFLFSIYSTSHVVINHVNIPFPKISRDVRIAHLSDIHIGHFRGETWLNSIVRKVNAEHPDIVVITGDLYESFYNLSIEKIRPLTKLNVPVLFVSGNHDSYVNLPRIKTMVKEAGLTLLDNETTVLNGVQFVGLAYNAEPDTLTKLNIDRSLPSVLLYHYPKGVPVANTLGISLVLSGHTHAGQFFPLTLINHFAFQYNSGLHRYPEDDTTNRYTYIYTSDGVGTTGPPLRFGTFAEIPIITLKASK
ncbi:MAG: metallophosphoesterase [Paludibacteraceae bacterium]|nr:metallophosphoesterase [Paludibacteraceae bacterium]